MPTGQEQHKPLAEAKEVMDLCEKFEGTRYAASQSRRWQNNREIPAPQFIC